MKPKHTKKPRKPKKLVYSCKCNYAYIGNDCIILSVDYLGHTPKEARKLAAWLVKAADFLEGK